VGWISGLARGFDTASHRGAVAEKGKTVAVLGTGIDVMYPKENTRLAEQIIARGGALITEFPVGTFPASQKLSDTEPDHQRDGGGGAGGGGGRV
jgi:DNA processing protein